MILMFCFFQDGFCVNYVNRSDALQHAFNHRFDEWFDHQQQHSSSSSSTSSSSLEITQPMRQMAKAILSNVLGGAGYALSHSQSLMSSAHQL
jgi:hypothetical protein